ncbi:MAG TPA: sugar-binding domain-containing protein, partial [Opitutaceae bacterium]
MKFLRTLLLAAVGLICALALLRVTAQAAEVAVARERIRFDDGWRFALGHATDKAKDFDFDTGYFSYLAKTGYGDGPADPHFDDRAWRTVNVPHDWAVELPFSDRTTASHGFKALGRLFPENSVGWYRKTFFVPGSDLGRKVHIVFDGVYRDAAVFVNGFFVGREPSGYTGVEYDLSDYLHYGAENVVTVRVDATDEEGWFYEGAGIYRHVWLMKTAPVHFVSDGTSIVTRSIGSRPEISTSVSIVNEGDRGSFQFRESVIDAAGKEIAATESKTVQLEGGATLALDNDLVLPGAKLWSLESPNLYSLVTIISDGAKELDRVSTSFGVRTVRFDPDHGFFLNDQHVVIKGTNNHQDHAGVGVAIPDALQVERLKRLKEFGSNAYRCSHNPPTPELLDACDRLGMLVLDENRLMGINDYHLDHL